MSKFIGLLLILLSLFSFYYTFKFPDKSKYWKWYALQRNIWGGIILFLLGLAYFFNLIEN